jgi:uncharacterized membrane protein
MKFTNGQKITIYSSVMVILLVIAGIVIYTIINSGLPFDVVIVPYAILVVASLIGIGISSYQYIKSILKGDCEK